MSAASRDPEQTRSALLDAALACFAQKGFDGTSVRAIAERAGLSLGLLYHYFPSKEAVLQALFDRSVSHIQGCFAEAAQVADPQSRLEALVRVSVRVMREQREFYRVSAGVRAQPGVLAALTAEAQQWEAAWLAAFTALLEAAGFDDPPVHAHLLLASLDGVCQHHALDPEHYPLDAVGERLVALLTDPRRRGGKGP